MPSPSLMPKGELLSSFPGRDGSTHPVSINRVSVIRFIPRRQKQGYRQDTVPVLMVAKVRQTLNN